RLRIDQVGRLPIYGGNDFSKTPKGMRCLGRIMEAGAAVIRAGPGDRRLAAAVHAGRAAGILPILKTYSAVAAIRSRAVCPVVAGHLSALCLLFLHAGASSRS